MRKINYKKFGFTLAEVLITLGVIGVVAAMTMPTLIKNYKKHVTISKLKKAFTFINQVYKMSYVNNVDLINNEDDSDKQYYESYYAPYLKNAVYCDNYKACGYNGEYPYKYSDKNTNVGYYFLTSNKHIAFITSDKILYRIPRNIVDNPSLMDELIILDINGGEKTKQIRK